MPDCASIASTTAREERLIWHPSHDLPEPEPGHWEMHDPRAGRDDPRPARKYGDIRLVKRADGEKGYRALVKLRASTVAVDLGLHRSLRDAAAAIYHVHLDDARGGRAPVGYPGRTDPSTRTERSTQSP